MFLNDHIEHILIDRLVLVLWLSFSNFFFLHIWCIFLVIYFLNSDTCCARELWISGYIHSWLLNAEVNFIYSINLYPNIVKIFDENDIHYIITSFPGLVGVDSGLGCPRISHLSIMITSYHSLYGADIIYLFFCIQML